VPSFFLRILFSPGVTAAVGAVAFFWAFVGS
jgi:hypothetical protein